MGWSASILRGRCDEGMTLLRSAKRGIQGEQPRGERREIGAEAAGICVREPNEHRMAQHGVEALLSGVASRMSY
jgi:hypothetical protein